MDVGRKMKFSGRFEDIWGVMTRKGRTEKYRAYAGRVLYAVRDLTQISSMGDYHYGESERAGPTLKRALLDQ